MTATATTSRSLGKAAAVALAALALIWAISQLTQSPLDQVRGATGSGAAGSGGGQTWAPPLPEASPPGPVEVRPAIDPREFRYNGMPYPGDPADPGFGTEPSYGIPSYPPIP